MILGFRGNPCLIIDQTIDFRQSAGSHLIVQLNIVNDVVVIVIMIIFN